MADATFHFPRDFQWGTATAAHQVEGDNANNDWHVWEQSGGGRIHADQVSGKACNWWAGHAEKDIRRMKELHTNAHRLSIEWSRIEPKPGKWNIAAIDRYREILTAMRKAGIEPMVTLHHFTNPIWLAERGGWLNEETPALFQKFAKKAVGELSDLCSVWCTINEPTVYAANGYFEGRWSPGHANPAEYFQAVYRLLEGHAAAYHAIHDIQPQAKVGLAHHMASFYPRSAANPLDRVVTWMLKRFFNDSTLDTLQTGEWKPLIGKQADMSRVVGTLDWIGLNYYQRYDAAFSLRALKSLGITYAARPGQPKGPLGWGELYPAGLLEHITRLHKQLGLPIYITENGVPDESDQTRPGFMLEHLREVWRAIQFNIPVMGYYFWSLLDNFEWSEGYNPQFRFGLYTMDFKTQKRTMTQSGALYKEIASSYAITSDMAWRYAPRTLETLFPGETPMRG